GRASDPPTTSPTTNPIPEKNERDADTESGNPFPPLAPAGGLPLLVPLAPGSPKDPRRRATPFPALSTPPPGQPDPPSRIVSCVIPLVGPVIGQHLFYCPRNIQHGLFIRQQGGLPQPESFPLRHPLRCRTSIRP